MASPSWCRTLLVPALLVVGGCASDYGPPGTGNSGRGSTPSMVTAAEQDNSPNPGGFGGAASRTMNGGPGSTTLIGTETGLEGSALRVTR